MEDADGESSAPKDYDVIVVGMGPAGAVLAIGLARAGYRVLGLERERFPRYHIGESLTGIAADVITKLGLEAEVEALGALPKPGVKVVGTHAKSEFFVPVARKTWQVRRAGFDDLLLRTAIAAGMEHQQGTVRNVLREGERVVGVSFDDAFGETHRVRARYVADCSGQSSLLCRLNVAGPRRIAMSGKQIAVFSQFEHAERDPGFQGNATCIFYSKQFHWAWFIPVSDTTTSVGCVIPTQTYRSVGDSSEEVFAWGTQHINPELNRRLQGRERVEPVRTIRNFSYSIDPYVGPGWVCVGDAHRFTDPIFSFGVSLAMTEASAAVELIAGMLEGVHETEAQRAYVDFCERGQSAVHDLIRYFWTFPSFFGYLTRGSLHADFQRLFAGDVYGDEPLEALVAMRKSLAEVRVDPEQSSKGEAIARRLRESRDMLEAVRSAYLEYSEDGIRVSLFLRHEDLDALDHLRAFERRLIGEFGREDLAVVAYPPRLAQSLFGADNTTDLHIPGGRRVFLREAS
ncbi:MAG: NAD(P)/FAD-dependent oxidoreductase [Myxococcota bacterium]